MKTIEEYNGCHYFLFMHFGKLSHVNLIASAYSWPGINFESLFGSFGGRDVIYTLVEK